jgi:hypothetical protein
MKSMAYLIDPNVSPGSRAPDSADRFARRTEGKHIAAFEEESAHMTDCLSPAMFVTLGALIIL